jgi:hypothetical protein
MVNWRREVAVLRWLGVLVALVAMLAIVFLVVVGRGA